MQRGDKRVTCGGWYVHAPFEIEVAILKSPVSREASCMAWIALRTRESEEENNLM